MPSSSDRGAHSLAPGAQAPAIADALLPDDRVEFQRQFDDEFAQAKKTHDLRPLLELLEQWRGRAILQAQPDRYFDDLRAAAKVATGEASPYDEDVDVTWRKVNGM